MSSSSSINTYWFQNPATLWNRPTEVLPASNMTYPEKVNALVRLSIYAGLLLSIVFRNYLWLYVPILTMALTWVLYLFRSSGGNGTEGGTIKESMSQQLNATPLSKVFDAQNELEHFGNTAIDATFPTTTNPFMNPMPFDDRRRPAAIKPSLASDKIERYFNKSLFRDVSDIFGRENSQREFYTVPSTTYPSNQPGFAEWLYKVPPTCKDGNGAQCVANNEGRLYGGGGGSFKLPYITDKYNKQALGL